MLNRFAATSSATPWQLLLKEKPTDLKTQCYKTIQLCSFGTDIRFAVTSSVTP